MAFSIKTCMRAAHLILGPSPADLSCSSSKLVQAANTADLSPLMIVWRWYLCRHQRLPRARTPAQLRCTPSAPSCPCMCSCRQRPMQLS